MRIIEIKNPQEAKKVMRDINVDAYGVKIMAPKAVTCLIRINSLSNIAANILKQEMLSLGGDVAIARGALTGAVKKGDCLIMGNLAQLEKLKDKLQRQPFGLGPIGAGLSLAAANYQKNSFDFICGRYKMKLSCRHTRLMGIVNLTPDSFSQDGISHLSLAEVEKKAQGLIDDGADILDFGGESTRPGAKAVSLKEELRRVIPAIKRIAKRSRVPISVDTYKPEVARQALDNGASIVNDITGLRSAGMRKIAADYKAGVIIMHMKGDNPRNMQKDPVYQSLLDEIIGYLRQAVETAVSCGISRNRIVIDPGIGFGKTKEHNLEILNRLKEFKVIGQPILAGVSRKAFIGKLIKAPVRERLSGTIASCVLAAENGAQILRVHDVKQVKQALRIADAVNNI